MMSWFDALINPRLYLRMMTLRQELAVRDAELKLIRQMRIEEESTLKGWKHE